MSTWNFDRDLRLVYPTTLSLQQIMEFVVILARLEGKSVNFQYIYRETGITANTQKKLLYALEAIFLIRTLRSSLGGGSYVIYFEDQAETLYLNNFNLESAQSIEGFLFRHARAHFAYQIGLRVSYFQFRTRAGIRVPFVVETPKGVLGLIPIEGAKPSRSQMAAARAILTQYVNCKVLFISTDGQWADIEKRLAVVPLYSIA